MATLTVRQLPDDAYRALKTRAAEHGRSMETEAREILQQGVAPDEGFIARWLAAAEDLRGDPLPIPVRTAAREIDFS